LVIDFKKKPFHKDGFFFSIRISEYSVIFLFTFVAIRLMLFGNHFNKNLIKTEK